ncbi:MAG: PQQ-dependent sugar dehydrogenase [bacterium]|nr:PQQ-dependent sugar dehydrogenase [bacterium]
MNYKSKKAIITYVIIILGAYLVLTGFQLLKKITGYNVPSLTRPDVTLQPGQTSLTHLKISDGFKIEVFAKDLSGPRVIAFGPSGEVLVSETKAGSVAILLDDDKDGVADSKKILIDGLNNPHGLAFFQKSDKDPTHLYIAESNEVRRYPYDVNKLELIDKTGQSIVNLPDGGRHFTRTIAFGPNFRETPILSGKRGNDTLAPTKLYVSVGSSCDICVESTWKRAAILESDPDGSYTAEFAGGLRNAVFFDFHPVTGEIWATEMGRDNLGDDLPPDEVNIIKVATNEHEFGARRYGWPFCYGKRVEDKTFKPAKVERIDIPSDCSQTESATIELPAHSAPLGLTFISADQWPSEYKNNLLVAYHGSWNRSEPTGYKIVRFVTDSKGNIIKSEDFISGWLKSKDEILGRPVDLKFDAGGLLYISDDAAGIIYKVTPLNG